MIRIFSVMKGCFEHTPGVYEIDVKLCAFGSSEMEKARKQFDEMSKE